MSSTNPDRNTKQVLEAASDEGVWSVTFHPDGMHLFTGTSNGIQQWLLADGQEVGGQTGMNVRAISVSRDQKWVVCGTKEGASVWDVEIQKKVIEMEGKVYVGGVDVAPDCARFATATDRKEASIWNITTGERLVGPLEHDGEVKAVRFSPDASGGRIATLCYGASPIRIFDSNDGNQLLSIENSMTFYSPLTPIAWSTDSQQLFAISDGHKINCFDSSTGSQLAEWQIHENSNPDDMSIALSPNNKLIASSSGRFLSFWDTSTRTQLGIVEDTSQIYSIAFSHDGNRLASGALGSGRIIIWDLRSGIIPESYLPIKSVSGYHVQPSTALQTLLMFPLDTKCDLGKATRAGDRRPS
ncbi:WD40-repeat-containing domain protein [Tylopilus felleus]